MSPGLIVLFGADPDVEIGIDPGSGEDTIDAHGLHQPGGLGDGHGTHAGILGDTAVQLAQKFAAAFVVVLPGILAVQNNGHERIPSGLQDAGAIFPDAAQEVLRGGLFVHFRIHKADQVAQEVVAKHEVQASISLRPPVRPVQPVHGYGAAQRAVQDAAVGSSPFEAKLAGDAEYLVRNRALRGPQPHRRDAEGGLNIFAGALELHAGVAGKAEPRRQRHARVRHSGDLGIAQQGQDGMVVRRSGDLDLPGGSQFLVNGEHAAHELALLLSHAPLIFRLEIAPAAQPVAHFAVVGQELFVEPRQLGPHLQVAKFLCTEDVGAGPLPGFECVEQLAVTRMPVDHALRIGIERMTQQEVLVRVSQALGRLEGHLEERVRGFARGVLGHLRHHGGHQVESLVDLREVLQDSGHAEIVLEGVHARPGQLILAGNQVLVIRLVHVPQEAQMNLGH